MSAKIEKKTVESLCKIIASGGTPLRSNEAYWKNGTVPWLKTGELNDANIYGAEEAITTEGLEQSSAKLFPENTILMAMYGDGKTITSLGRLKTQLATNQACCAMVVNEEVCDKDYFFYLLKNERHRLLSLVVAGAQRNLSLGIVRNFQLPVLPRMDQKNIGDCLKAYDDLIENNRRRIALLEEAARLLYREWFVHFRFPGAEHVKIADGMPEGWEDVRLQDACSLVTDGTHDSPKLQSEGVPFIKGKHISSGDVDFEGCDYISVEDHAKCSKRVLPQKFDVLLSNIGSIGDSAQVLTEREFSIKNVALLRANSEKMDSEFLYYLLKSSEMNSKLLNLKSGSAQPFISLTSMRNLKILLPSIAIQMVWADQIRPITRLRYLLNEEINQLAKARDLLLPRLMDGRLEI